VGAIDNARKALRAQPRSKRAIAEATGSGAFSCSISAFESARSSSAVPEEMVAWRAFVPLSCSMRGSSSVESAIRTRP
jgi:hypothetical protein